MKKYKIISNIFIIIISYIILLWICISLNYVIFIKIKFNCIKEKFFLYLIKYDLFF